MDSLGDRIKDYENVSRDFLLKRSPVIIRVDGKAFHTFTQGFEKPFSSKFMEAMDKSAFLTASNIQGFKVAYVQSDEVTFLITDYDKLDTQGWFGYNKSKIISISASTMSVEFNNAFPNDKRPFPIFDSRAFNVPKDDIINTFLWRAKDWHRNSVQMYCRSFFSDKEMHKKGVKDQHDLLHSIGKNWSTDLTDREKNGKFIFNGSGYNFRSDILPTYESISQAFNKYNLDWLEL
jgi:tRNA(His) 5'-end guanylyltransferase